MTIEWHLYIKGTLGGHDLKLLPLLHKCLSYIAFYCKNLLVAKLRWCQNQIILLMLRNIWSVSSNYAMNSMAVCSGVYIICHNLVSKSGNDPACIDHFIRTTHKHTTIYIHHTNMAAIATCMISYELDGQSQNRQCYSYIIIIASDDVKKAVGEVTHDHQPVQ